MPGKLKYGIKGEYKVVENIKIIPYTPDRNSRNT
jgi:hypothetical protein